MIALKSHQENIVKILLKYGVDLDLINKNGENAVKLATKLGNYNIAILMEAHRGKYYFHTYNKYNKYLIKMHHGSRM